MRIGLVQAALFSADWERVLSNSSFQLWAGRRNVLLAFAYGTGTHKTHVSSATLRVLGPDVRCQFRDVIAWDVLGCPMHLHPRWLAEAPVADFSGLA